MTDGTTTHPNTVPRGGEIFSLELSDLLAQLRRRWWVIVGAIVLGAAGFYVAASRQPKVYTATAKVVIDPVLPKVLEEGFDIDSAGHTAEQIFYNTQYEVMRSRAVVRAAIAQLKLADDPAFLESYGLVGLERERLLQAIEDILNNRLEVVPEHQSRIVAVMVEDYDPDRAARTANKIAQVYIDQSLDGRLAETHSASKWLDERLDEFGKRLDSSEKALHEFKRENMLVSVSLEDRKNMVSSRLTSLNDQINEVKSKLISVEAERAVLQSVADSASASRAEILAVPRIAKNPVIETLLATQVGLEQEYAKLGSRYGDKHPNMTAVQNQIESSRQRVQSEMARVTATIDNEIAELKAAETKLSSEINLEIKKAMDINNLAIDYNRLSRDVGTNEKTYGALLKRQTEADLSGMLKSNFVRWLETAEPNPRPVRPVVGLNTLLGAVLGLLIGLSFIGISVVLDTTVHTQEDVEGRLQIPFLGLLPSIDEKEKRPKKGKNEVDPVAARARDLHIISSPKSSVAECVRSLRTNLLFLGARKPLRRLLVTSAGPSEGKSTTVIALGATMAQAGNRVLLIDTDFRRPRLHKTFGVSNSEGLTSLLLKTATVESAIRHTDLHGMDLLPCGPLPPNPSEIMHTEAFLKLLDELTDRYDRVLLDSPPVNVVTDATILSQIVDGTILVIKASKTTKESVRRAARQLQDINANLLGAVLNDVDLESRGYYRSKYHYYYRKYDYSVDAEKEGKA